MDTLCGGTRAGTPHHGDRADGGMRATRGRRWRVSGQRARSGDTAARCTRRPRMLRAQPAAVARSRHTPGCRWGPIPF